MKYKKLVNGAKWVECEFNPSLKQVQLYEFINGIMIPDAIGLY